MVFGEFSAFARDFDIVPALLSKGELYYVFRKTRRRFSHEASPYLKQSSKVYHEELRCAL